MNNKVKFIGIAFVAVLAVAALGFGVAFAQTQTPDDNYGPSWMMGGRGGMMGGYARNGGGWEWMDAMHEWMAASGGMHTFVWNALADTFGLSGNELNAEANSGKTIAQIAEEKGISRVDLVAALEAAHAKSLAQAVADGYLTQVQADSLLAQMAGRYEWMIDNMGAGYGFAGGRGGMMGRYSGQQGSNGQFTPGGCHGYWNDDPADEQPRP